MLIRSSVPLLALLLAVATAAAQPVYETRDRAGPVFSDIPSPGASELNLPPLNSSDSPRAPADSTQSAPAGAYSTLRIVEPESGGTIHTNTGEFTVRLTIDPPLRTARGDAIVVRLDNTALPTRRTTTEFDISAAEWEGAAVENVEHQLEAAVVDSSGKAIIVAPSIRFYTHRASRLLRPGQR
ncbi:MAG TPA: hypothetical protein PLO14_12235 [Accumulibacter sp.]|uniref:DUF4124 domain-containing protein n=1 Tax=Accumulibacter sp. TaxID=2053492 RepID=UPI0025EC7077|nr:DUF4124 domain-containing protein [Accumulibacter sp.]MCM8597664.1 hypothetical protein [Accumulibacter sp.]MCM8661847.1 hypothetical protein [Accumulibacter sp.]HNC52988.1 hypothetical protein [Accumulibacter sp.]